MSRQHPQRPASYKGRTGSTADLAMSHLEANGPTGEIALAAAIDREAHELGGLLAWAVRQGALTREVVGDEWVYSMGDGEPAAVAPAAAAPPPRAARNRASTAAPAPQSADEPAPSIPVEKPGGLRGKNAALWLTGELAFEATDGTVIVFDQALAKRMAVFLLPIFEAAA